MAHNCWFVGFGLRYVPLLSQYHVPLVREAWRVPRGGRVAKAMRQAGAAAGGMARAAARAVWTMFGGGHVEEAAEQSGTRTGDHGEPGEAAVGDG